MESSAEKRNCNNQQDRYYAQQRHNNENDIQYSVSAFGYLVEPVEPGRLVFVYSFNFFVVSIVLLP